MTHDKTKKLKVIDIEKLDEKDDNAGGPIDTVDIFDEVTDGDFLDANHGFRRNLEDIENPLSNENADILRSNLYESEPDKGESE